MLPTDENNHHIRCGWSTLLNYKLLGECENSFGFCSCSKTVNGGIFDDYGIKYGSVSDVVSAFLDLDSTPCSISYMVNGQALGTAFEFNKEDLNGAALYPHIQTKNITFTVNFGQYPNSLQGISISGYDVIGNSNNLIGTECPTKPEAVEFYNVMPNERFTWISQHVTNNPKVGYAIIGVKEIIDRLAVR